MFACSQSRNHGGFGDAEAGRQHASAEFRRPELLDDRPVHGPDAVVGHRGIAGPDVVVGDDGADAARMAGRKAQRVVASETTRPEMGARDADAVQEITQVVGEDVEVVGMPRGVGDIRRPQPAGLPGQKPVAVEMRSHEVVLEVRSGPSAQEEQRLAVTPRVVEPELDRAGIDEPAQLERDPRRPPVEAAHCPSVQPNRSAATRCPRVRPASRKPVANRQASPITTCRATGGASL
jgi:hypothetical protein